MFRKSKADEIHNFFTLPLEKNQLAIYHLDVSGFMIRTHSNNILIDPAGMLKNDEIKVLKAVNLILLTHNHLDHFNSGSTRAISKVTNSSVIAESQVADKLTGKIPADKLVIAQSGKKYTIGDMTINAIQGIHRGPIILYQLRMNDATLFHAGDSGYVNLKEYPSQVAIVPVGGLSPTASPENAFKMVADLKPEIAISMHGSKNQKRQFEQKVKEALLGTTVLEMEHFTFRIFSL